jgi:hypothetical protein
MASKTTQKPKGFRLPCLKCQEANCVSLNLYDFSGENGDEFRCYECEETFSLTDVRNILESYGPLMAWLELAPERKEDE